METLRKSYREATYDIYDDKINTNYVYLYPGNKVS